MWEGTLFVVNKWFLQYVFINTILSSRRYQKVKSTPDEITECAFQAKCKRLHAICCLLYRSVSAHKCSFSKRNGKDKPKPDKNGYLRGRGGRSRKEVEGTGDSFEHSFLQFQLWSHINVHIQKRKCKKKRKEKTASPSVQLKRKHRNLDRYQTDRPYKSQVNVEYTSGIILRKRRMNKLWNSRAWVWGQEGRLSGVLWETAAEDPRRVIGTSGSRGGRTEFPAGHLNSLSPRLQGDQGSHEASRVFIWTKEGAE